jgi:cyclic beta-1,2-glucan synthetase
MSQLRDQRWEAAQKDERAYWSARLVQECGVWVESIDNYLCWLETLARPPDTFLRELGEDVVAVRRQTLNEIPSLRMLAEQPLPLETILARRGMPDMRPEAAAWLDQIEAQFSQSRARAREAVEGLKHLADRANTLADGINMRFLYDEKRRLFSVGYALGGPPEFTSYYDLLASESRLASLVAIAKRDVPIEHWFALNRPRSGAGDHQALLSWSGTMFEYLMPLLFTRTYANSLLDRLAMRRFAGKSSTDEKREFRGAFPNLPTARSTTSESISIVLSACRLLRCIRTSTPNRWSPLMPRCWR